MNPMETTETKETQPTSKIELVAAENGVLTPRNIDEAYRLAKGYVLSGMLPERYKTPEMVIAAMQYANELGLKPLTAMRQIAVVKGTPCVFGDLPLSLCYAKNLVEWIKEYWFDKSGKKICAENNNLTADAFGAICIAKRRGDPEPIECSFTMDEAQKAGLANGPTWKSYPKRMLRYRARSQALKDKFPDALNGIAIAEYDFHVNPDESDVQAAAVAADPGLELQQRFAVDAEIVEGEA